MKRPYSIVSICSPCLLSLGLSCLALTWTAAGHAQTVDELGGYGERPRVETSRDFTLELRGGPYLPRVDSEFDNGEHPFRDYFGKKNRVMVGAEFDWLPLVIPDTMRIGAGAGIGYTAMSAKAHSHDEPDVKVGQDTRFRVMPHWLVGVAKLDILHKRTFVPLVFTGKLGLANALWWVSDNPSINSYERVKGRSMSSGIYYGIGVAADLGFLDPYRSRRMDALMGIHSMYFTFEFYGLELNNFGANDTMHVGDRTWAVGLAFDF